MKQLLNLIIVLLIMPFAARAQFAPPAGQEGTTAMYKDSSAFVSWANVCEVARGLLDISQPDSGYVSAGEASMALGIADNQIVSLGDGGMATLGFEYPISNGPGYDFAVFENAFLDNFLELAFVEVSSNGIEFFRFPSVSLTQTEEQVSSFGFLDATQIHNLAGKYRLDYGVPFNLDDVADIPGLNADSISFVRIVDVVGTIDTSFATYDSQGHPVNDPWPTAFPSGGFDLDAVGVIHSLWQDIRDIKIKERIQFYPNPCTDKLFLKSASGAAISGIEILSLQGTVVYKKNSLKRSETLDLHHLPPGIYMLRYLNDGRTEYQKIVKK